MMRGVSEQDLARLRPLEEEVSGVLPGEAHAAVDLDRVSGRLEEGVGAEGLCDCGRLEEAVVVFGCRKAGPVRGGLRELGRHQHIRALVLDRLIGADGSTELQPRAGVLDRHLETSLRAADLLGRECGCRQRDRAFQ